MRSGEPRLRLHAELYPKFTPKATVSQCYPPLKSTSANILGQGDAPQRPTITSCFLPKLYLLWCISVVRARVDRERRRRVLGGTAVGEPVSRPRRRHRGSAGRRYVGLNATFHHRTLWVFSFPTTLVPVSTVVNRALHLFSSPSGCSFNGFGGVHSLIEGGRRS